MFDYNLRRASDIRLRSGVRGGASELVLLIIVGIHTNLVKYLRISISLECLNGSVRIKLCFSVANISRIKNINTFAYKCMQHTAFY